MLAHGVIFINAVDIIDCAYFDPCCGVVGQSWYLDVRAQGQCDRNYFVSDFKELKHKICTFVRHQLDHRLLLPTHPAVQKCGATWLLDTTTACWEYTCPSTAVLQLPTPCIDRNSIAAWLNAALQDNLGAEPRITATLREQPTVHGYCFNYTHGLPGHTGNCQRLLHGHLGRVLVRKNGASCMSLENYLAHTVLKRNVHFLNSQHITVSGTRLTLAYTSSQGDFSATLPRQHAIILPAMESSIEAITHYLAAQLQAHNSVPHDTEIVCYEGMDKGSSCLLKSNATVSATVKTGNACSS